MATGTLVRKVLLKMSADDGDTEQKLDKISRKADELARKHPDLTPRINTAAATAKLAVLRKELKATDAEADKSKVSIKGVGLALGELAMGALPTGLGEMNMFQKAMLGLNLATGIGEPAVAGLTVAVGGLSAGLVAAGAGLGVFGLVAKGVYSQVSSAVQAFQTAQNTTGKASATAMKQYQAYMAALPPAQRAVARSIDGAESAWQKFVQHNTSGVAKIMSQGIGLLPKVFAAMQPFLGPTEKALHGLIGDLSKGLSSSGFKSWIASFAQASGPMITNLGHAIGHIVVGIGGILKAFLPVAAKMTGGLDSITAKFAKWGTTLSGHSGFKALMSMFKSDTPLLMKDIGNIASVIKNLLGDMTGLSTFSNSKMLLQIAQPITGLMAAIAKGNPDLVNFGLYAFAAFSGIKKISSGISGVSSAIGTVKELALKFGLLKVAAAESAVATEGEAAAQEAADAAMAVNPIGLIVIAIAGLVVAFVELWKHFKGFRDFWKDAWKDIKGAAVAAWHFIDDKMIHPLMHGIGDVVNFVRGHWKLLATIIGTVLLGPIAGLVIFIGTHWKQISSLTSRLVHDVISFFGKLPGELFTIGKNAVMGLVHGIEHMFGAVGSAIGHLASLIPSGLSKILSIFSPSRVTMRHGQMIGLGLALGMESMTGRVSAATTRLAHAAIPGGGYGHPAYAGGGYGRAGVLQIEWVGGSGADQEFITFLKKHIRIRGGNPSVLGR